MFQLSKLPTGQQQPASQRCRTMEQQFSVGEQTEPMPIEAGAVSDVTFTLTAPVIIHFRASPSLPVPKRHLSDTLSKAIGDVENVFWHFDGRLMKLLRAESNYWPLFFDCAASTLSVTVSRRYFPVS
jgi:hypothetical protein